MASELAVGYVTLVPSAKGIAAGLEKEMTGPLVLAGQTSGAKSSAKFGTAFKSGLKTAAIGVGVIAGIAAIGKQFDDAFNTIARGTGATGETLKSLDNSFKTVLKSGSGSFDQVSAAVTTLFQRTGLTGKALESFAAKEVTLARITKTDVNANLQATTSLFNLYGIAATQQSGKLDVLFRASQVAGVSITQLADDMRAAAPTAKILGLNIDQTASLVANLDKAGLPASKVMLGLAGAFAKAAKAGKPPLTVIHDLVAQIKAAPNATDAATIAIQRFGIGARQASTLVAGIRSGAIDLNKSLDGGKGILATAAATQTLSGKFAHLKNVALVGLEPLATAVLGGLARAVQDVIPAIEFLTRHMEIVGPIMVAAATAFVAFKVAVGIGKIIDATSAALLRMQGAITGTSAAQTAATAAAATAAAAKTAEAVAATEAAAALSLEGEAAAAAAAAGGAVDLTAFAAAAGLQAEAVAATEAAAAMTADAAATEAATVAAKGFSLTGIGAAVAVAAVAVGLFVAKTKLFSKGQQDAGKATNDLIDSLLEEGKTLEQTAGQVLVKAIHDNHTLADAYKNLGVPLNTVTAALAGNKKALEQVGVAEQAKLKSGKLTFDQALALDKSFKAQSLSLKNSARDFKNSTDATKNLAVAEGATVDSATKAAHAQDTLRLAATNLTTAIINNADRLRGLQEGLIGVFQSAINLKQGVRDLADKQAEYNKFVAAGTQNTKEGQAALEAVQLQQLSNIQSTDQSVDSTRTWADQQSGLSDALKTQTDAQTNLTKVQGDAKSSAEDVAAAQAGLSKATDVVAAAQKKFRDDIKAVADRISGPLHQALLDYIALQDKVKPKKPTEFTTPGLDAAFTRTHNYRGEMDKLPAKKHTDITLDANQAISTIAEFRRLVESIPNNVSFRQAIAFSGGRGLPGGAHGLVATRPQLALIGENAATTPEIVSPVKLMAETFKAELDKNRGGRGSQVVFTGDIYTRDERELMRKLDERIRRAEILAGV